MRCFIVYFYLHKLPRKVCFWGESSSLQPVGILHRKMVSVCFLSNRLFKNKGHWLVLMFSFYCTVPFIQRLRFSCLLFDLEITLVVFPCR